MDKGLANRVGDVVGRVRKAIQAVERQREGERGGGVRERERERERERGVRVSGCVLHPDAPTRWLRAAVLDVVRHLQAATCKYTYTHACKYMHACA